MARVTTLLALCYDAETTAEIERLARRSPTVNARLWAAQWACDALDADAYAQQVEEMDAGDMEVWEID